MSGGQSKDKQWFDWVWQMYHHSILTYCAHVLLAYGGGIAEAADIAQATFITAWEYRHRIPDDDPFAWLRNTARNHIRNHARKHQYRSIVQAEILNEMPDLAAAEAMTAVVGRIELQNYLKQLPFMYRELLIEAYLLDMSCAEIAAIHGTTTAATRKRLGRAREMLRRVAGKPATTVSVR